MEEEGDGAEKKGDRGEMRDLPDDFFAGESEPARSLRSATPPPSPRPVFPPRAASPESGRALEAGADAGAVRAVTSLFDLAVPDELVMPITAASAADDSLVRKLRHARALRESGAPFFEWLHTVIGGDFSDAFVAPKDVSRELRAMRIAPVAPLRAAATKHSPTSLVTKLIVSVDAPRGDGTIDFQRSLQVTRTRLPEIAATLGDLGHDDGRCSALVVSHLDGTDIYVSSLYRAAEGFGPVDVCLAEALAEMEEICASRRPRARPRTQPALEHAGEGSGDRGEHTPSARGGIVDISAVIADDTLERRIALLASNRWDPDATPIPKDEIPRLAELNSYGILDSEEEECFDRVTRACTRLFSVPIALVSLIDSDRQWFLSHHGLDAKQTPRCEAFCAWAINDSAKMVFEVCDSRRDPRFAGNPLVVGPPHVLYYAGAPIISANGRAMGTLCLIDHAPRQPLTNAQRTSLMDLAGVVMDSIVNHARSRALKSAIANSAVHTGAMKKQREVYLNALDSISDAIVIVSLDSKVIEQFLDKSHSGGSSRASARRQYSADSGADDAPGTNGSGARARSIIHERSFRAGGGALGSESIARSNVSLGGGAASEESGSDWGGTTAGPETDVREMVEAVIAATRILHYNAGFSKMTGLSSEVIFASNIDVICAGDCEMRSQVAAIIASGESGRMRVAITTKDESRMWCHLSLTPVDMPLRHSDRRTSDRRTSTRNTFSATSHAYTAKEPLNSGADSSTGLDSSSRGGIAYWAFVLHDVSEEAGRERDLEQAKNDAVAEARAKDVFLRTVSHELRTPLNSIITGVKMLPIIPPALSDEQLELVSLLETGAETLLSLICNILDYASIGTRRVVVRESPTRVWDMVDAAVSILAPLATSKKLDLRTFVDINVPIVVLADVKLLRQVLINIVGNAIKFTSSGTVTLHVSMATSKAGGPSRLDTAASATSLALSSLVAATVANAAVSSSSLSSSLHSSSASLSSSPSPPMPLSRQPRRLNGSFPTPTPAGVSALGGGGVDDSGQHLATVHRIRKALVAQEELHSTFPPEADAAAPPPAAPSAGQNAPPAPASDPDGPGSSARLPTAGGHPPFIRFACTDTGPGVPEDIRDKIFDPFVRAEKTSSIEGTGLGLAIVRSVIDACGGEVGCDEGEGGVGATMWFTIPTHVATLDAVPEEAATSHPRLSPDLRLVIVAEPGVGREHIERTVSFARAVSLHVKLLSSLDDIRTMLPRWNPDSASPSAPAVVMTVHEDGGISVCDARWFVRGGTEARASFSVTSHASFSAFMATVSRAIDAGALVMPPTSTSGTLASGQGHRRGPGGDDSSREPPRTGGGRSGDAAGNDAENATGPRGVSVAGTSRSVAAEGAGETGHAHARPTPAPASPSVAQKPGGATGVRAGAVRDEKVVSARIRATGTVVSCPQPDAAADPGARREAASSAESYESSSTQRSKGSRRRNKTVEPRPAARVPCEPRRSRSERENRVAAGVGAVDDVHGAVDADSRDEDPHAGRRRRVARGVDGGPRSDGGHGVGARGCARGREGADDAEETPMPFYGSGVIDDPAGQDMVPVAPTITTPAARRRQLVRPSAHQEELAGSRFASGVDDLTRPSPPLRHTSMDLAPGGSVESGRSKLKSQAAMLSRGGTVTFSKVRSTSTSSLFGDPSDLRILVVDDISSNRKVLQVILRHLGYKSSALAGNGKEAVEQYRKSLDCGDPFHVVLMDLRMPVMDGFEACGELLGEWGRHSGTKSMQVARPLMVAVTADTVDSVRIACEAKGFDAWLSKPLSREAVGDILRSHATGQSIPLVARI